MLTNTIQSLQGCVKNMLFIIFNKFERLQCERICGDNQYNMYHGYFFLGMGLLVAWVCNLISRSYHSSSYKTQTPLYIYEEKCLMIAHNVGLFLP